MKRYLILGIFLIGIVIGVSWWVLDRPVDMHVYTRIEKENGTEISINYPVTGIRKLDRLVETAVSQQETLFRAEAEGMMREFNVDYRYWVVNDRYIQIVLTFFRNNEGLAHPINEIKTFVFDRSKNKILTLSDIMTQEELTRLVPVLQQKFIQKYKDCILMDELQSVIGPDFASYSLFTFNDEVLTFYFNPYEITAGYCNIVSITIPWQEINSKIKITKDVFMDVSWVDSNRSVIDVSKKVVALTFDDGPSKYTNEILTILKEENAVATFFVLGNKVESYQDTIRQAILNGNELGNHSYNHKSMRRLSKEEIQKQVNDTQEVIYRFTGYTPTYLRPTYGFSNQKIRTSTNLEIVLWNVDSLDWKLKNVKTIVNRTMDDVYDGAIILMHDTHARTVEVVRDLIKKLKEQDYQFVTVSELAELKKLKM